MTSSLQLLENKNLKEGDSRDSRQVSTSILHIKQNNHEEYVSSNSSRTDKSVSSSKVVASNSSGICKYLIN